MVDDTNKESSSTASSEDNKDENIVRRDRGPSIFGISVKDITIANSALTVGLAGGLAFVLYKLFFEKPADTYSKDDLEKDRQVLYNERQKFLEQQNSAGGNVPQIDQPLVHMYPEEDYSRQVEPPANEPNPHHDYKYEPLEEPRRRTQQQELYADNGMINMSTLQQPPNQMPPTNPNLNMNRNFVPAIPNVDRRHVRDMSFD